MMVDAEAMKRTRKAAEDGDADAQNNLGSIYLRGQGVPRSDAEAVRWFRMAAEQGNAVAQVVLDLKYEYGGGGRPHDDEDAVKWYRKTAKRTPWKIETRRSGGVAEV